MTYLNYEEVFCLQVVKLQLKLHHQREIADSDNTETKEWIWAQMSTGQMLWSVPSYSPPTGPSSLHTLAPFSPLPNALP